MHLRQRPAEVQTYACTVNMKVLRRLALVEPLEEALRFVILEARATVNDLDHGHRALRVLALASVPAGRAGRWGLAGEHQSDFATVRGIFKSVRQQVRDDLVKLYAVYPHLHGFLRMVKDIGNAALLGIIFIEFKDAPDELRQLCLAAVQLHLLLVNLALVEYLVDQ